MLTAEINGEYFREYSEQSGRQLPDGVRDRGQPKDVREHPGDQPG